MTTKKTKKPSASTVSRAKKEKTTHRKTKRSAASVKPPKDVRRPRKRRGPSVTSPIRSAPPRSVRSRLIRLFMPIVAGGIIGCSVAGFFLWSRAISDVDTFLERPPSQQPALLLSAPMTLYPQQELIPTEFTSDLLSAGYEQVDVVTRDNQFSVQGSDFSIRTGEHTIAGTSVNASKAHLTIERNQITKTSSIPIRLRPSVLARVGELNTQRTHISLSDISPHVANAVTGMEDHRFREHGGVDPIGILRALYHNLRSSQSTHGGSTITQQLAKNLFLSQERTLQRKVREVFFAAALEARMSKDALLELYLSEVYLGQSSGVPLHGIEAAARQWFGVSADKLSLSQSALIAGVISAPNAYSPVRHPNRAIERRNIVLDKLVRLGRISENEAASAKQEMITLATVWKGRAARAPWAMDVVTERLETELGPTILSRSGLQVFTTIQPHLQRLAQRTVSEHLQTLEREYVASLGAEAALVSIDSESGHVVALVGGRSYYDSPFNRATAATRQGGSIVKPLLLVSAMNRDPNLHPASRIDDAPIERNLDGKTWRPTNSDQTFKGEVSLREAIENSRNIPAVHLSERIGLSGTQSDLKKYGLSRASRLPSVALGAFPVTPLEAASSYTVFPNQGTLKPATLIQAVVQSDNTVLWTPEVTPKTVAQHRATTLTHSILQGVLTQGTGRSAVHYGLNENFAGKTGTTDQFRDAWFVGYSPVVTTSVWVGKDRGGGIGLSGARAALPIWARFMTRAGADRGELTRPAQTQFHTVCNASGQLASEKCPQMYDEIFWADQTMPTSCELHGGPKWSIGQIFKGFFRSKKNKTESVAN